METKQEIKTDKVTGGKSTVKVNPTKESLKEVLTKATPVKDVVHDFVHSKNPKFAKDNTKQRIKRALGAWYGMHPEKSNKEEIEHALEEIMNEGDYWHPDPEQDKKLSDRGAKLRAREDQDAKKPSSSNDKTLRPGESYMDYAKRHGYKSSPKPPSIKDRIKSRLGLKNSFDPEGEVLESAVPGKPAERLGAVSAIPADEREAAKQRTLAKAAAKRKEREMAKEDFSVDQFDESRRMDREGVDRNDTARKNRTMAAKASLAAKQKRQAVLDKHEKKTGNKLDISRSKEGREHAAKFPGSRQEPKKRGEKETPLETHNRRVNTYNARILKHGRTTKQKKEAEGMAKHTSRFD